MSSSPHTRAVELAAAPSGARVVVATPAELAQRWQAEAEQAVFRRGWHEGRAEALAGAARALDAAVEELARLREQACARLASDAAHLAVEIARELVRGEVQAQRHDVERIVRETLTSSGVGRGACVVHVHPRDAERLAKAHFRARTQVEPDPAVAEGDVHVTTPQGLLVRELDAALDAIAERLREDLA